MMMTTILVALIGGVCAATMFASIASGAFASLLLFYLSPLPLMVLTLGWGSFAGVLGGAIAALGLGILFGLPYMLAFALTVALPALWLGYLALLARPIDPVTPGQPPALDWYPVGRLLTWIAGFSSVTTIIAILTLGTDEATINAALRQAFERLLSGGLPNQDSGVADRVLDILVTLAPSGATMIAMLTLTMNLWLAAKVTATSQRLKRPWPDLRAIELPRSLLLILGVALLVSFVGGLATIIARIVGSSLLLAYGLVGFAVLHTVTQAMAGRAFILGGLYAVTMFVGWPVLGAIMLGVADAIFGLRQRYWDKQRKLPPTI